MYLMKQAGFFSRLRRKKKTTLTPSSKSGATNTIKEKARKVGKSIGESVKENVGESVTAGIKQQKNQRRQELKEKLGTAAKVGAGVAVTGAAAAGAKKVYDDHLETQRRRASNKGEARKLLFGERKKKR